MGQKNPRNAKRAARARKIQRERGGSYMSALRIADQEHQTLAPRPGDVITYGDDHGVFLEGGKVLLPDGRVVTMPENPVAFRLNDKDFAHAPLLLDALGITDIDTWDPAESWSAPSAPGTVRVPVGMGWDVQAGTRTHEVVSFDLARCGLVQGRTGSGKSTLLRELVITACATHSPERLALVLCDYKGGMTFHGCERLPHVLAKLSRNTSSSEATDILVDFVKTEHDRREALLTRYHVSCIEDYQRVRGRRSKANRESMPAMPSLIVVVDESQEHTPEHEALRSLLDRCRKNAAVGIHLVISEQHVKNWDSAVSWGLSLAVNSPASLKEVIGVDAKPHLSIGFGEALLKDWDSHSDPIRLGIFNIHEQPYGSERSLGDALMQRIEPLEESRVPELREEWLDAQRRYDQKTRPVDGEIALEEVNLFSDVAPHTVIHGQAGSGLTVLASRLIRHVRASSQPEKRQVVTFTYLEDTDREEGDVVMSLRTDFSRIQQWWENTWSYRAGLSATERENLPRILVVLNLAHTLDMSPLGMGTATPDEVSRLATQMTALGRELRVHVLYVSSAYPPDTVTAVVPNFLLLSSRPETLPLLGHGNPRLAHLVGKLAPGKGQALLTGPFMDPYTGTEVDDPDIFALDFSTSSPPLHLHREAEEYRRRVVRETLFCEAGIEIL